MCIKSEEQVNELYLTHLKSGKLLEVIRQLLSYFLPGTITVVVDNYQSFKKYTYAKKINAFLTAANFSNISIKQTAWLTKQLQDPAKQQLLIEETLTQLEYHTTVEKSVLQGKTLRALVDGKISFEQYRQITHSITAIHPEGLRALQQLHQDPQAGLDKQLGAFLIGSGFTAYSTGAGAGNDGRIFLTELGNMFCELIHTDAH